MPETKAVIELFEETNATEKYLIEFLLNNHADSLYKALGGGWSKEYLNEIEKL